MKCDERIICVLNFASSRHVAARLLTTLLLATVLGCSQHSPAPVADRSPVFADVAAYVVRPGDTLYSIAWRFELDVDVLASRNRLTAPYVIRPGQRIELRRSVVSTSSQASRKPAATPTTPAKPAKPAVTAKPAPERPTGSGSGQPIRWQAPVASGLVRDFGAGNKGRDYELDPPASVRAAADGHVVYVGAGLGGYAHLIILRHAGSWLSAYSVNVAPVISEGSQIKAGGKLADIGSKASRLNRLHFEIRKEGDPVDPSTVIR